MHSALKSPGGNGGFHKGAVRGSGLSRHAPALLLPLPYSMANWNEVRQSLEGKVWMEVGVEELTTKDFQLSHQPKFIRA